MKPNEMIEVLKAFERGEEIEVRHKVLGRSTESWDVTLNPSWDFLYLDYRIKPKPKFTPEQEEIIKADKEGKQIQFDFLNSPIGWDDRELRQGDFRFDLFRYRIKPEPREWWLVKFFGDSDYTAMDSKPPILNKGIHVREVID